MFASPRWVISMPANSKKAKSQQGFTLIEIIASMVITALAFTALANFFFNQTSRAIEPIFETRAAKLGEALMDEILSRPYDEFTAVGGVPACNETGADDCTVIADLGADDEEVGNRDLFDDVDDYNVYCNVATPFDVVNALGENPGDFDGFTMSICVNYDGDYDGDLNEVDAGGVLEVYEAKAKLIVIDILPPSAAGVGSAISFQAYRGNF